jgi:hypothetical protein
MTKPDYIKNVEEKEGFLSTFELYSTMPSTTKIDNNKNLILVVSECKFIDNKPQYDSKLYKTSTGFYIYWRRTVMDEFKIVVYHRPENINEVIIFLTQLNKK